MTVVRAAPLQALRFDGDRLMALDQTALPWRQHELELRSAAEVAAAIKRLAIRGAPLIGVAAAYGLAIELAQDPGSLEASAELLRGARPTAVNLARAVDRVAEAARRASATDAAPAALAEAQAIEAEEVAASAAIATHGAELLAGAKRILTHCNTGSLAAPGRGTALAVIAELDPTQVLVCEARPLLQGARLTVFELAHLGIAHRLVVDAAAPGVIASGGVDAVVVGCDRVAANGDVANKVGTYPLALAANAAGIPFVVAGPTSSVDRDSPDGPSIEVEQRDSDEVRTAGGHPLTFPDTPCLNPAFDITPAPLVSALVTERGVAQPVDRDSVAALLRT